MILYVMLLLLTTAAALPVMKTEAGSAGYRPCRQTVVNRICLCGIFLMLFAVSTARYGIGNDYGRYQEHFFNIWYGYVVPTEHGFNLLVKCLQILVGKENYLFLFAFFAFVTIFITLKALYTLSAGFVFSFYLFMAFGYYYQSLNTVRYYLALALALYSIVYLFKKNYGKFVLTVLFGALIHKSVLIVLPVYLLANCRWKKWQIAAVSVFAMSGLIFGKYYLKLILYLYPTYRDTIYLEGGTSPVNIVRCLMVLAFCLCFYKEAVQKEDHMLFYFRLNIAALMLFLCGSFLPEVSRLGTYMTVTQVFLLPGVVRGIQNARRKKMAAAGVICFAAVYFVAFLCRADDEMIKLLPYRTWLF